MIIDYANKDIENICNNQQYASRKYPKQICKKLHELMVKLDSYDSIHYFYTLKVLKNYRCHELKGNKKGIISLSLDEKYRMELKVKIEKIDGKDVIIILEVSNHYGD